MLVSLSFPAELLCLHLSLPPLCTVGLIIHFHTLPSICVIPPLCLSLSLSLSLTLSLSHSAMLRKRLIIPFYRKQWNRCLQCWSFLFLLLLVVRLWRSFKTTPLRELQKLSRWRQMWGGGVGGAKRKSVILARAEGCSLSPGLLAHSGNWFALHLNGFI